MKYYLVLFLNCVLIWFIVMFFADNRLIPGGTLPKIRNLLLVCLFFTIGYNLVSIYILKSNAPESGLLYKTAAGAKNTAGNFATYINPFQKELVVYSLIAAGLIITGLVLLGIPGAIFLQVPVKLGICNAITGDGAWPAAILLTILWPLCLPAGIFFEKLDDNARPYFFFSCCTFTGNTRRRAAVDNAGVCDVKMTMLIR